MSYPCHACDQTQPCSVDVLPGRASAIQATRGGWYRQAWRRNVHHRSTLAEFTAQPKSVFLPPRARVHRKTRQQGWSRLLKLLHFSEHVFQRLWSERGVFQCATCDGANTFPKWQREPTTGFALLAGDEGDPFAQEDPLDESEEVHNSKREPLIEEGLSDGHRLNRLVLGNREVHSGY